MLVETIQLFPSSNKRSCLCIKSIPMSKRRALYQIIIYEKSKNETGII